LGFFFQSKQRLGNLSSKEVTSVIKYFYIDSCNKLKFKDDILLGKMALGKD